MITATSLADTTKSATVTTTITPVPPPLAVGITVSPSSFYASTSGAARTGGIAAVVIGDTAAAGVD